jgi:hypothetical protein
MFPLLVTMYVRLARHEEAEARRAFGAAYDLCRCDAGLVPSSRRTVLGGPAHDGCTMMVDHALSRPGRPAAIGRYLVAIALGNLIWETAQLPLYTLWHTEPARTIVRAVLHCTAGDIAIAAAVLVIALATVGNARWPDEGMVAVAAAVIAIGVAYTIGSEYINTVVRRSWSYTEWMPTLPWLGTGLAPLAQWFIVPAFALVLARRGSRQ